MKTLLLALLCFTPYVFSEIVHQGEFNGFTYYLLQYNENNTDVVDLFQVDSTGFQERVSHQEFVDAKLANQAATQFKRKFKLHLQSKKRLNPKIKLGLPGTSVWPVVNSWNEKWEDLYSQWMTENFSPTFLYSNNISTDCADVPIAMRWIFARIHGLPVGNHLAGSGDLFTQDSAPEKWLALPTHAEWEKDQRFLKALSYIKDNTFTGTVFYDLYPIEIAPRWLTAGAIWLTNGSHTQNVAPISTTEVSLNFYSSTTPQDVRILYTDSFYKSQPSPEHDGFRRPRWLQKTSAGWEMTDPEAMPGYSLEQFAIDFMREGRTFEFEVYSRVFGQVPNPKIQYTLLVKNLDARFVQRENLVKEAYYRCYLQHCTVGSADYEAWSTPGRDEHILENIQSIERIVQQNPSDLEQDWEDLKKEDYISIFLIDEQSYLDFTLEKLIEIWKAHLYSSDPNDSMRRRWGG